MAQPILTCPNPAKWLRQIAQSITQDGDCWHWTDPLDRHGYGRFRYTLDGRRRQTSAHRASWLAHRGDIPLSLVPDHLCRHRWCVNPWHMELVTNQINTARGDHSGKKGRSGRPRSTLGLHACGKHGRADGYEVIRKDGYTAWTCRICAADRRVRYLARLA